jgi:hypothetical protein
MKSVLVPIGPAHVAAELTLIQPARDVRSGDIRNDPAASAGINSLPQFNDVDRTSDVAAAPRCGIPETQTTRISVFCPEAFRKLNQPLGISDRRYVEARDKRCSYPATATVNLKRNRNNLWHPLRHQPMPMWLNDEPPVATAFPGNRARVWPSGNPQHRDESARINRCAIHDGLGGNVLSSPDTVRM